VISLAVSVRLVFFNIRLRSVEARHSLLRDANQAHEIAVKSQIEAEYLRTIAPGTLFEEELAEMAFPQIKSLADSLEKLIKEYRSLPIPQAIGLHAAYHDRVLAMQSAVTAHANRLAFIRATVGEHGRSTA
jgi:hypothetical protein